MSKWFTVTIDTEGDRACPFFGNRWGPLTGQFRSVQDAIPELRFIWDEFSVKPTYLASSEVLSSPTCIQVLKQEQAAGAEIGTHLHVGDAFPCNSPQERERLYEITSLYTQVLGCAPQCYRAGRYGMGDRTPATLTELGYTVDTSVTPQVDWSAQGGPDYSHFPGQPYWMGGMLEVPVTILGMRPWWPFNGWAKHRWLRPSVATAEQLKSLVDSACAAGFTVLNMTFHTMELVPGASPYVRTPVGAYFYLMRLESVIRHIVERGFEPVTLSGLHSAWSRSAPETRRVAG